MFHANRRRGPNRKEYLHSRSQARVAGMFGGGGRLPVRPPPSRHRCPHSPPLALTAPNISTFLDRETIGAWFSAPSLLSFPCKPMWLDQTASMQERGRVFRPANSPGSLPAPYPAVIDSSSASLRGRGAPPPPLGPNKDRSTWPAGGGIKRKAPNPFPRWSEPRSDVWARQW